MPGKYLEYIRAGRYVVPVELSFLSSKQNDESDEEIVTSKWMERKHWKEIKTMLKPAVELVGKYNESGTDKISKSHHVQFGHEISFGYIILLNKDKCPFVAVLDPKRNTWTDDEEDVETDENSGLADFGGRHKSFTPTKYYIKGCVAKKSASQVEDGKKIRKELGVKNDDVRNFFQSSPSSSGPTLSSVTNQPFPVIATHEKPHKPKTRRKKRDKPKRKLERQERSNTNIQHIRDYSSSEESLIDLPPPGCPTINTRTPMQFGNTLRSRETAIIPHRSPVIDYLLESDVLPIDDTVDLGGKGILSDSVDDVFSSSSLFRNWIEDDDDEFDEELPDIEETSLHTSRKGKRTTGSRKKFGSDKSPAKNNQASGLPDIDDSNKKGKTKKKRNVAIVEPMKHMKSTSTGQMSFEEAVGAMSVPSTNMHERKKRVRSSPTIDRLLNSRKNANSAIEIVRENSELPHSDTRSQNSTEKRKRKDVGQKKRRRVKHVDPSLTNRLTPSPFPESPERLDEVEDDFASYESNSEPEMPVLTKMVISDDDQNNSTLMSTHSHEIVPPLEPETLTPVHEYLRPEAHKGVQPVRRSPSPDIADHHCVHSRQLVDNSILFHNSEQHSNIRKRIIHSDSDDITSESAYRKTPFRRKKRKRYIPSFLRTSNQCTHSQDLRSRSSLSPSKQTGDAQTQTTVAVPPFSNFIESPAEINITVPDKPSIFSVKTERYSQSEDSDNLHDAVSDDGDEEVLFAGQYQAIPVLTLDSPGQGGGQEDDEDEELFSFDRPASVKIEAQSINSVDPNSLVNTLQIDAVVEETTDDDIDFEYSFDFIARARKSHAISRAGGPQGSAIVLNALSDNPAQIEISTELDTQAPRENQDENDERVENLSTFQLMKHPRTLRAGFGFLNKVMSNNGNSDDIYKQFGMDKRDKKKTNEQSRQRQTDCDLMPPPPAKRPVSPDICSLNPEQRLRKSKSKRPDNRYQRQDNSEISRSDSPIPGPSSGIRHSQTLTHFAIDDSEDDDDHYPKGADHFREFMSRAQEPRIEYQPRGDEYDLTQASQCMPAVVQDYVEKSRTYKKHTKNIEDMTPDQFKEYFGIIKPQILGIVEGTEDSVRNLLYCNKSHQDIRTLKSLNVITPFHEEHGNTLNAWLYNLLLPYSGSTLKCADYVNYVMRPEAFIRIYSYVNNISRETSEKEMLSGACWEGPYNNLAGDG